MKKILLITFLLTSLFVFSQELDDPTTTIKISDISLPSAHSFEMTKRGGVPVDESTGRLGLSVPLGNFIEGEINIPIFLSYNGPGVKMTDVSSWTGTNWVLNAGGVITRIVKDLPDDYNEEKTYDLLYTLGTDPSDELLSNNQNKIKNNKNYDSQYDVFNFSFLKYSGEFILKRNGNNLTPLIIKNKDDIKIELVGTFNKDEHYEFLITTTDGMKFYFGGHIYPSDLEPTTEYAIEETQIADNEISNRRNKQYKSAFYLSKIESIKGDVVYFEYHNESVYKNYFLDNQFIDNLILSTYFEIDASDLCTEAFLETSPNYAFRFIDNRVFNGKFLKKISGNYVSGNYVLFDSQKKITPDLTNLGGTELLKYRILTNITFKDKKVNLQYYPPIEEILYNNNDYDRFFLKDVKFLNNINQSKDENIKLEYYNLENTKLQINKAQDHMGYYNGVNNNQSLLPKNSYKYIKEFVNSTHPVSTLEFSNTGFIFEGNNLADREPRFEYAKYGSLRRIIYPEKGFSEFEYEPVIKNEIIENKELNIFHNRTGNCKMKDELFLSNMYVGLDGEIYSGTFPSQNLLITIHLSGINWPGVNLDYHDFGRLKITNLTTNEVTIKKIHLNAEDLYPVYELDESVINNNDGASAKLHFVFDYKNYNQYKFELEYGDENYGSNNDIISDPNSSFLSNTGVTVDFKFQSGLDLNDGLGIRVKRVKDYSNTNPNPEIKRYYYKALHETENLYFDNKIDTFNPFYFDAFSSKHNAEVVCTNECEINPNKKSMIYYNYYLRLQSNSIYNKMPSQDVAAIYKNVTISYGGDQFENGGVQKNFSMILDTNEFSFNFNKIDCQVHFDPCGPNASIQGTATFPGVVRSSFGENIISLMKSYRSLNKSNYGALNGTLISEDYFVNIDKLRKNKSIKYDYIISKYNRVDSFTPMMIYDLQFYIEPCIQNYYLGTYETYFYKPYLKEVITTEYIDLVDYLEFRKQHYQKGDSHKDFDNDGILNFMDEDYLITFEEYEADRKKIVTKISYDYSLTNRVSMPNSISTSTSESDVFNIKKLYYPIPNQISLLSNLMPPDDENYLALNSNYIINKPIQIENFIGIQKLSTNRIAYRNFENKILPYKSLSSKGDGNLEFSEEITRYDNKWNPIEIKNKERIFTSYIWSPQRQLLAKAVNATIIDFQAAISNSGLSMNEVGITASVPPLTLYQNLPNSFITFYKYNPISKKLINEIDANGQVKTYVYDSFYDLKFIKDHDGNIVKEFEQHFKPQN